MAKTYGSYKKSLPEEAKRLKLIRKELDITQTELSELLGVTQPTVQKYETGDVFIPTEVWRKIHKKFNYSYEYLIDGIKVKMKGKPEKSELITDIKELKQQYDIVLFNLDSMKSQLNKLYRDFYAEKNTKVGQNTDK